LFGLPEKLSYSFQSLTIPGPLGFIIIALAFFFFIKLLFQGPFNLKVILYMAIHTSSAFTVVIKNGFAKPLQYVLLTSIFGLFSGVIFGL